MRRITSVFLPMNTGIVRADLPLGWIALGVRYDRGCAALDAMVYADAPPLPTALYVLNVRDGFSVPDYCSRYLGTAGDCYVFEVDPRSVEAR